LTDLVTSPVGDDWDWISCINQDGWNGHWIARDIHKKQRDIDLVILYLHGGGFTFGHSTMYMPTFRFIIDQLFNKHNIHAHILSVDYSKSPEYPWPKASNECLDAYRYLVCKMGISSSRIIIGTYYIYIYITIIIIYLILCFFKLVIVLEEI
jgi:acetyl esterase/lipase